MRRGMCNREKCRENRAQVGSVRYIIHHGFLCHTPPFYAQQGPGNESQHHSYYTIQLCFFR